jgi:hypothetical protein
MARVTNYVVQPYIAGRGAGLKADTPTPCKSAEHATRMAEKMATSKLGVVAYATSGDQETGDYDDEPVILFRAGRLPEQFAG